MSFTVSTSFSNILFVLKSFIILFKSIFFSLSIFQYSKIYSQTSSSL
ncbi:hypothetical protein HOF65_00100 [bacterium]|nr:hypothetical protein [bacterium]MBT3852451.1 hypothetical protein [bacterium]MBT4632797.1 hypothetical protein [bacterium]